MKLFTFFVFLVFWTFSGFGSSEIQRVILPGKFTMKSNNGLIKFESLNCDYSSEGLFSSRISKNIQIGRAFFDENVIVKINGKKSNLKFHELISDSLGILNLTFFKRPELIILHINNENSNKYKIKNLELEFVTPVYVGSKNSKSENFENAKLIFNNYGFELSQRELSQKLKLVDILQSNKRLQVNENGELSDETKLWISLYEKQYDFTILNGIQFKSLITSSILKLDEKGELTENSLKKLNLVYLYFNDLESQIWLSYNSQENFLTSSWSSSDEEVSNEEKRVLEYKRNVSVTNELKTFFYKTESQLTRLNNPALQDTIIDGAKHVLMVAWKSASFMNYTQKASNGLTCYKSSDELFKYALFLTTKYDLEKRNKTEHFDALPKEECRTRLMQVLGLPPTATNDYFVEFWVKESDVFRPAIDSSMACNQIVATPDSSYIQYLSTFSCNSYNNDNLFYQYPFTALGYTWDWNPANATHFGVTEFVVREKRTIYIRRSLKTEDYVKTLH